LNPPDVFSEAFAGAAARLGIFGRQVHWFEETQSTNDLAGSLADRGADEGTIIVAETQTAGRGRQGRVWCSPPGAGLYVSTILRPPAHALPLITVAAGVALVEGIRAATGLLAALKWPNDLYVNDRKLAGILAETPGGHVVLGFGINVRRTAYPPEIAERATSVEQELGRAIDLDVPLVECLAALAARYDDLRNGRTAAVLDAWRRYARPLLGRMVECAGADGVRRQGVAEDIDSSGALIVRTADATLRVISGEVRWL